MMLRNLERPIFSAKSWCNSRNLILKKKGNSWYRTIEQSAGKHLELVRRNYLLEGHGSVFLCNCMPGVLHSLGQLGLGDSRNWLTNHICILQVSFVFTNQVHGKLVLIESVE
jgi:hypothetical protein